MRIGLREIDPQIAQMMADKLCAPLKEFLDPNIYWGGLFRNRKREPSDLEREVYQIRRHREEQTVLRMVAGAVGPLLPATLLSMELGSASPIVGMFSFFGIWAGGVMLGIRWSGRATPRARLRHAVRLEELKAVSPLLKLSRAERVYCDALLMLAHMEISDDTEPKLRYTLQQLNNLLENSRKLENRRLSLLPVLGTNVIADLEAEYGRLGRRLDTTTDALTRESLEQSLRMCAARLENARAFEQGLARLNAQQEAILHTIASAHSALARMQIVPEPETGLAAEVISETVTQMNQQTYAVEQAVQEVMSLRVS